MENKPRKLSGTFFNLHFDRPQLQQPAVYTSAYARRPSGAVPMCAADKGQYMVDKPVLPDWRGRHCYLQSGCAARRGTRSVAGRSGRTASQLPMSMQKVCRLTRLIAEGEYPVCLVRTACQAGRRDHAPAVSAQRRCGNLYAVCCSLAEAMLNLTDSCSAVVSTSRSSSSVKCRLC